MTSQKTFLVVDDDESVRRVLERYFTKKGIKIVTAKNGKEAIDHIQNNTPNLVLLDIRMPEMDGLEVLRRLKTFAPKLPVIMVSAVDDVDTAKLAISLGAKDFIKKPIDLEYLDSTSFWLSWLSE